MFNEESNKTAQDFIRSKIAEIVKDPETAKKLMPDYLWGTKRQIIDSNYYETYNRDNVSLIDVRSNPIVGITPKGIKTTAGEEELDMIVFATGYDGMTGPLFKIDIRGRDGISLKDKWEDGEATRTYFGLSTNGFPNMFMMTGPESPSCAEQYADFHRTACRMDQDCLNYMRDNDYNLIEANEQAENEWSDHVRELAEQTLYVKTDSWYMGANIEGKPRRFPIYVGGVGTYRKKCEEIANNGYEGFYYLKKLRKNHHASHFIINYLQTIINSVKFH